MRDDDRWFLRPSEACLLCYVTIDRLQKHLTIVLCCSTMQGGLPASSAPTFNSDGHSHNAVTPPVRPHHPSPPSGGVPIHVDNPMPHRLPEGENAAPLEVIGTTASDKLVIIMVGLPATGALADASIVITTFFEQCTNGIMEMSS